MYLYFVFKKELLTTKDQRNFRLNNRSHGLKCPLCKQLLPENNSDVIILETHTLPQCGLYLITICRSCLEKKSSCFHVDNFNDYDIEYMGPIPEKHILEMYGIEL